MDKEAILLTAAILVAALMVSVTVAVTSHDDDDTPNWASDAAAKLNKSGGQIEYLKYPSGTSTATWTMSKDVTVSATPVGFVVHEHLYRDYLIPYDRVVKVQV